MVRGVFLIFVETFKLFVREILAPLKLVQQKHSDAVVGGLCCASPLRGLLVDCTTILRSRPYKITFPDGLGKNISEVLFVSRITGTS